MRYRNNLTWRLVACSCGVTYHLCQELSGRATHNDYRLPNGETLILASLFLFA